MYRSPFLGLNEAAVLIARRLAETRPTKYTDDTSALDEARRQLVRALFDGTVHSEGVWWAVGPPLEDQSEPPASPTADIWKPIEAGWWSYTRFEKYIEPVFDICTALGLEKTEDYQKDYAEQSSEVSPETENGEPKYRLDKIIINWSVDGFEIEDDFDDPYGYTRIRVRRTDVDTSFNVLEEELQPTAFQHLTETVPSAEIGKRRKQRTKPDPVRTAVYAWLEDCLQEHGRDWVERNSDPWLRDRYFRTAKPAKCSRDYVRKLIGAWRKETPDNE
jgi:hypothetical protein